MSNQNIAKPTRQLLQQEIQFKVADIQRTENPGFIAIGLYFYFA